MKQTAVEWLVDKFSTQGTLHSSDISQAKEMEKEQIINAYWNGDISDNKVEEEVFKYAEQYYNETYGK